MIEEIGKIIDKNIDNNFTFEKNAFKNNQYCLADEIWNILDKYKDKECKYKNAWEELKEQQEINEKNALNVGSCLELIKELETKNGIEVK